MNHFELPEDPFNPGRADEIELSEDIALRIAIEGEQGLQDTSKLERDLMVGESFASWLAEQFPELFGGEKTPDALTALELLRELKSRDN